jgi:hypothetical protein
MTTGTWDPNEIEANDFYEIDLKLLGKISQFMQENKPEQIEDCLTKQEIEDHKNIMRQPKEKWFTVSENFTNQELLNLIQFFTLAEVQYDNWEAEDLSPVIGLSKSLRQRGEKLEKSFLKWIRLNNSNKFLPYGPLI